MSAGTRCEYAMIGPDSPDWLRCIAPVATVLRVPGMNASASPVGVCLDHVERLRVLVDLAAAEQRDDRFLPFRKPVPGGVVSCPPNAHHGGSIEWSIHERGNACPVCGRYV